MSIHDHVLSDCRLICNYIDLFIQYSIDMSYLPQNHLPPQNNQINQDSHSYLGLWTLRNRYTCISANEGINLIHLLHELQCKQWLDEITRKPKLCTYVTFKNTYEVQPYSLSFMNRKHRSYLAQYRCGIYH